VLKPVNDEMREIQRDALVSYVLHQMSLKPQTVHIDTPDKLFEYFLMDVQMEPCMLTSRIRHSLSSVQLFIGRCLMNLEPDVAPTSINAKFWESMGRYRLWEANRRVFLYPESWLEPELRDDMSPFFKEMMSELLQSDITEDKASIALSNYLSKLEEVAKLEPCGIYCVEGDKGTADDIDHVVARTSGANRKYFYRQRTASWMPWEQIKLDIEDNPVLPVVWKDRLFLFWLRLIKQTPVDPQVMDTSSTVGDLTTANLGDVKTDAQNSAKKNTKITVQMVLCWSEFHNGKWQPTKTSDVDRPSYLGSYDAAGDFDRSVIRLYSEELGDERLRIVIKDTKKLVFTFFDLYNTHSLPERLEDATPMSLSYFDIPLRADHYRTIAVVGDTLNLSYGYTTGGVQESSLLDRPVLSTKDGNLCRVIEPLHHLTNPWDAPFFLENKRHVFYVTTTHQAVLLPDWNWFGVTYELVTAKGAIPSIVLKRPLTQLVACKIPPAPVGGGDPGIMNTAPIERFVSEDAYINKGIGTTNNIQYGGVEIGPRGKIGSSQHVEM